MKHSQITIKFRNREYKVEALIISRQWAVNDALYLDGSRADGFYCVTHIPTGLSAGDPLKRSVAIKLATALSKREWPDDIDSFTRNTKRMIELRRYARDVMIELGIERPVNVRVSGELKHNIEYWRKAVVSNAS